jgi:HSP20 family protein
MKKSDKIKSTNNLKNFFSKIKNYNYSKGFIATLFLVIGVGSTLTFQTFAYDNKSQYQFRELHQDIQLKMMQKKIFEMDRFLKRFHQDQFVRSYKFFDDYDYYRDPFVEIDKIYDHINQRIQRQNTYFDNIYKENFKNKFDNKISINRKEDKKYLYFYLTFNNISQDDVNIKVKDNILNISSQKEEKSDINDKNIRKKTYSSSNFDYSFALPKNIDKKAIIDRNKNKIIIKFSKNL